MKLEFIISLGQVYRQQMDYLYWIDPSIKSHSHCSKKGNSKVTFIKFSLQTGHRVLTLYKWCKLQTKYKMQTEIKTASLSFCTRYFTFLYVTQSLSFPGLRQSFPASVDKYFFNFVLDFFYILRIANWKGAVSWIGENTIFGKCVSPNNWSRCLWPWQGICVHCSLNCALHDISLEKSKEHSVTLLVFVCSSLIFYNLYRACGLGT